MPDRLAIQRRVIRLAQDFRIAVSVGVDYLRVKIDVEFDLGLEERGIALCGNTDDQPGQRAQRKRDCKKSVELATTLRRLTFFYFPGALGIGDRFALSGYGFGLRHISHIVLCISAQHAMR